MGLWTPHAGPQTEALRRSEREILMGGARGGCKTETGIVWMVEPEYIRHPKYRGLVIRKNAKDLSDWVSRAYLMYKGMCKKSGNPPVFRFKSGAEIRTGHLKDVNAYEQYQGHEYQKMLIEELTQIPFLERYQMLIGSCRSTMGLPSQVFNTTNPGGKGHRWVKERWISIPDRKGGHTTSRNKAYFDPQSTKDLPLTRIFIPSKVEDNPTLMEKDPLYVKSLDSLPEKLRRAWRYGDWSVIEGQFFEEWEEKTHVITPFSIPTDWNRFVAIDYGTSKPFSAHWYAVDYNKNVFCYKEIYEAGLNAYQQADLIKELTLPGESIKRYIADPSMWAKTQSINGSRSANISLESIADQYRKRELILHPGNNDRVSGANIVRQYLQGAKDKNHPGLFVFRNCINMIECIPSLVYDDLKPEDVDTDMDDHAYDDLRYMLMHVIKSEKERVELVETPSIFEYKSNDIRNFWE